MTIVKMALAIIVIVALFASGVTFLNSVIPTLAEDGEDDKFQLAPLNPDFIEFLEEPPESFYGYIPPTMDLSHLEGISAQESMALLAQLPSSWDWRDYGKVTPVKNQNPCGTCWAFGTTSVLESAVLLGESTGYDFSEQSVALCVDRSWVYLYDEPDEPCMGGGNSLKASEVFIKKGSVLESCNPYNTAGLNCDGTCVCDNCTPVKKVTGYRHVTDDESQTALIKAAVYNNGPVTMSFFYDSSGEYADGTYGAIYDYYPCYKDSNHLVSIIGWDDDVPHKDPRDPSHYGTTGAWLVKNSWGTADPWAGDAITSDGYFWLAYDSSCMTGIAYLEYGDYNPNETLYYWDEIGKWDSAGTGYTETCWMASVFTSAQDGDLTHVDFWTTDEDASYEIYVYNDGDPSNGLQNQLAYQTGSCDEYGYYSIPLTSPVPVSNGQQFTVAVEMTTPGYYYPVPIEYEYTGYCEPPIQTGVCFISVDGSVWEDAGDVYDWNVCLRARITSNVDHFKCYLPEGVEPIGEVVHLEDQFIELDALVTNTSFFCNPVEKLHDEELTPILNPDYHLMVYNLEYEDEPQLWQVTVNNQFGEQMLTVSSNSVGLAVPTQKEYHDPPVGLDHYLLYEVIEGPSMGVAVNLSDQFGDDPGVLVIEPAYFANPVQKTHGGNVTDIMNPHEHLVFYEIWGTEAPYLQVQVVNQFGGQTLDLGYPAEWLAVPSEKLIPVPVVDKAVSPEGNVRAGQTLDYTVRYENEGAGTAFGVNVTDVLHAGLDDSTLVIGAGGTYDKPTRTITWLIGTVDPGVGGTLTFSANVRSDATHGTAVTNYATVYFPSVHEEIATNIVVNTVDTAPPTITGRSPTGSSVSVDSSITIDFSESMDTTSARNAFSISPTVPGSFSWTGDTTMIFNPTTNLAYSTAYTVTIDGTAKDSAGNGLDGNENGIAEDSPADDYTWSFTTRAAGGGCFIATAAYGTPIAEEIQILREFRDEYLLTNPVGQALVDLYYTVSPPMAEFITGHPSLKPIVRAGLVPALAMSTIAVNTTPAGKMVIVGLVVLVSVALAVWAKRRRDRSPRYT